MVEVQLGFRELDIMVVMQVVILDQIIHLLGAVLVLAVKVETLEFLVQGVVVVLLVLRRLQLHQVLQDSGLQRYQQY